MSQIFHYRSNSGAAVVGEGKGKRFLRFGTKGSPDIVCVINGNYVGIEVKGMKGYQSPDQKLFQEALEEVGGRYILARSLDDVIEGLKNIEL